jgi:hypothetical protein
MSTLLANWPITTPTATPEATRLALKIGGYTLGLWCERGMTVALDPKQESFAIAQADQGACDVELDVSWADGLQVPASSAAFVSGGLWSAFTNSTGTRFYFSTPALGATPYKAAWFDPSFQRGHVVLNRSCFSAAAPVFPLEYPIDELAIMHRLALGEGVEVHALGLADQDERGYLFLGHSGAGKSTTARLWMAEPGVKLLSDDRIILRKQDGKFWMYGTPWHGDAGVASAACAPLSSVFLLEQAPKNQILPVAPGKAAAELFARSFVPHYLKAGIQFSLSFFDELTRSIPCSIFRFAPTDSAVEAIRHARE